MPNPSWVLTEMKYETISDDRKEVRATSFCAIKFYPNESPGRSKYTKPSTKTTNYLKGSKGSANYIHKGWKSIYITSML